MFDRGTLRGRLTWSYASALVLALAAFALVALVVLDRAQRAALDAQLSTVSRAVLAIADHKDDRVSFDLEDRRQVQNIVGAKASGAIFQSDGRVAAQTGAGVPSAVRDAALAVTQSKLQTVRDADVRLRVLAAPVRVNGSRIGAVAVWRDLAEIEALDRRVGLAFALAIPLFAALAILLGGEIARRGLASLGRIATLAGEIEAHDLDRRLNLPQRTDELGRLAATFDRMLDRLGGAFARERRFTSDASHELRAPLSVIRAEADLALRSPRHPDEYRRALSVIVEEAVALENLTRDLLAAARADAGEPVPGGTSDLTDVARSVGARLGVLAQKHGVRIALREPFDEAVVATDRATLERAIVPVVHNAITHARTVVELRTERDGDFAVFAVRDDGPGFSASALEHAFDRFWRDDEARAREGSGLGLPIARTLMHRFGGSIAIGNDSGGGASVRLRLPRVQPPAGASSS